MAGMYGCFKSRNFHAKTLVDNLPTDSHRKASVFTMKWRMSPWGTGFGSGRSSDSVAMASGPPDVMDHQEPAEVVEECSAKKKSKFQTFKKFFARKKRKETPATGAEAGLKASQSSDNVSKTSQNNTLTRSEKDKSSGSKTSLGSKALSHDSVFVLDSSEATEALGASQDSNHGKVKSLQLQLRQAIRLGSPPSLMCVKKTDDAGAMSEDDGLPCSPPEYTALHTVMAQRNSSISLEGVDSDSDQLSCAASSRAVSPLAVPGDFSQPASPFGCLDNSAAKHKLGLRHKAGNRRKPVARLEVKAEGGSAAEETLDSSTTEAAEERERPKTTEVVSGDELKPKGDREEEEEDEEEEEEQPQHSRHSLLRDEEEEREEGEDQSEAEQDVSHGPDSSSPPELPLPEEEAPDARPRPSSKPSSRDSSLDSPGATPEPPAGPREYLLDPPGVAYGAEVRAVESNLALSGEEDGVQEDREEESSFLQEVLSSLKTPLASCSLAIETEGVVLEIEEEEEKEREDVEVEEGEEVKEEEAAVDEPAGSLLSDHTAEEEEEEEEKVATLSTASCRDVEEEREEEAAEEEELVVEHFCQHDREDGEEEEAEEEEAEEVTPEERDDIQTRNSVHQAEEEGRGGGGGEEEEEESEGEEEAIELEKEPEAEEEGREKREEEEVEEAALRVEEAEEAIEGEREAAEEMTETFPDAADEEVAMLAPQEEEDEGVDVAVGDDTVRVNDGETEPGNAAAHESRAASDQSFGEEREDGEKKVEDGVEVNRAEQEEDESERDLQQEGVERSTDPVRVSARPPPLSLPEPHDEAQSQESGTSTPSKTGTTIIHINLLSPSSEKATPFFQQSPAAARPNESGTPGHAAAATEEEEEEEEPADDVEEDKQSAPEGEAAPPASVRGEATRPTSGSDQSKARFTVAPAWQRSPSAGEAEETVTPPFSPPAVTGGGGAAAEAADSKDPEVEAEPASPAKVELALSPGRVRSAGAAAPPPSSIQPPTTASTEERSVVVEGKTDSPFGVRLRKTSALHLVSSEEENTEPPIEPPAQPTSCRVDSQQPISVKPSISQPVSIKPALPKKPDVHGDSGGKNKRTSDPAPVRGLSGGSGPPSWITMAKQKQKIYKENSLDEITVRKEEQERKSSLPMHVSPAASREHSNRTAESTDKVSPLEISKHSASAEKEARRSRSPPTPVPPHPLRSQSLPCPVPPKPQLPPATAKHPPQPNPPQPNPPTRSLSTPAPIPVPQKSPSFTSLPSPTKTATSSKTPQPQSTTPTSLPFSSRSAPEKSGSRAPVLSSQTPASQRGLPPPASPQDEPPWMALAKKKAKAWSEMPQIVQ